MAGTKTQPQAKQGGRKLNKAQEKAMRVRAAQTIPRQLHHDHASGTATLVSGAAPATVSATPTPTRAEHTVRKPGAIRSRVVAHPFVLSKQQEYAFIRADLIRLLTTMAILFVLMLVLLYIVEG